jgi:hypothetical protein
MKNLLVKNKKKNFLRLICLTENEKRIMQKYNCVSPKLRILFAKRVNR